MILNGLIMLPSHFHHVTYDHKYLVKNTEGAYKEPSKKYKSNLEEQATSNAEQNTSITRI